MLIEFKYRKKIIIQLKSEYFRQLYRSLIDFSRFCNAYSSIFNNALVHSYLVYFFILKKKEEKKTLGTVIVFFYLYVITFVMKKLHYKYFFIYYFVIHNLLITSFFFSSYSLMYNLKLYSCIINDVSI